MFHLLGHLPTHLYPISIYSSRNYQTRQWNLDSKKKTKSIQPPIRADAPLCSCLPPSCPGLINLHVSLHHTRLPSFHDSPRTKSRSLTLSAHSGKLFGKKERNGRREGAVAVMVMAVHYSGTTFQIPDKNVLLLCNCPPCSIPRSRRSRPEQPTGLVKTDLG